MNTEVTHVLIEDVDIDAMKAKRASERCRIGNPLARARDGAKALQLLSTGKVRRSCIVLADPKMPRAIRHKSRHGTHHGSGLHPSIVFTLVTPKSLEDIKHSSGSFVAGQFIDKTIGAVKPRVATVLQRYWRIAHLPGTTLSHGASLP